MANFANGLVVPTPSLPLMILLLPKYALPVVVAQPLTVRPPICVPLPMVEEAKAVRPPLRFARPLTPSVPKLAAVAKRLVDEATVEKRAVEVALVRSVLPLSVVEASETLVKTVRVPVALILAPEMSPEKKPLPCTERTCDGELVPIPTLPVLVTTNSVVVAA